MSLRWKLFRFFSVDTLLAPRPADSVDATDTSPSLFPSLPPPPPPPPPPSSSSTSSSPTSTSTTLSSASASVLPKLAAAADKAVHYDNCGAFIVFSLPRAEVQLFYLPSLLQQSQQQPQPQQQQQTTATKLKATTLTFPPTLSFAAHDNAVLNAILVPVPAALPLLVTLGIDTSGACVKQWTLSQGERAPRVTCSASYPLKGDARPVTLAARYAPDMPYVRDVAVGFADGVVSIMSSPDFSPATRLGPAPGEMMEQNPIIFLKYASSSSSSSSTTMTTKARAHSFLYAVSCASIAVIERLSSSRYRRRVLDTSGVSSSLRCALYDADPAGEQLIVAKNEGLYFFTRDGRGSCLAFITDTDGRHAAYARVHTLSNYIVHCNDGAVTVYDVVNKLVTYRSKAILNAVISIPQSRALLTCANDASVLRLREAPLTDRVSMLLKRGLYVQATRLAKTHAHDHSATHTSLQHYRSVYLSAIKQYATFLLTKNMYDEAADQLICSIPLSVHLSDFNIVPPAWVITRLIEQPGLRAGLRRYLEALHTHGMAQFVHTKVLITCYKHDRLRSAILNGRHTNNNNNADDDDDDDHLINVLSNIDAWNERQIDITVNLLRKAGLHNMALKIAQRKGRHVLLARVLLFDFGKTTQVLDLIASLTDTADITAIVTQCGTRLLRHSPAPFVKCLSDVIYKVATSPTDGRNLINDDDDDEEDDDEKDGGGAKSLHGRRKEARIQKQLLEFHHVTKQLDFDMLLPLFMDVPQWRAALLHALLNKQSSIKTAQVPQTWLLLFQSLVCVDLGDRLAGRLDIPVVNSDNTGSSSVEEEPEQPEQEQEDEKEDQVVEQQQNEEEEEETREEEKEEDDVQQQQQQHDNKSKEEKEEEERKEKERQLHVALPKYTGALNALQNRLSVINLRDALEVAEQYGQHDCLLYLYEQLRMYRELGIALRLAGRHEELYRVCKRHGKREPYLWHESIKLFLPLTSPTSSTTSTTTSTYPTCGQAQDVIDESIQCLELSATESVNALVSAHPTGCWGVVREYFERQHSSIRRDALHAELAAESLRQEQDSLHKEAMHLEQDPVVIKPGKCAASGDTLTLPAVHFMCGCSYNVAALPDGNIADATCPKCGPELEAAMSMKKAVAQRNGRHDDFFAALRSSKDGLATVMELIEYSPFI